MPIIINELDAIIAEKPRVDARPRRRGTRKKSEQPRALRPADVLHIAAWHERRMARLTAD